MLCNAYGVNPRLRMHPRVRRCAATLGWIMQRLRRKSPTFTIDSKLDDLAAGEA
jgi:hypothetical protein